MGPVCLFAVHLLQYRSSLCLHPGNGLLLLCFYIASLWLRQYLLHRPSVYGIKGLGKVDQYFVASWLFARTSSRIRRIVEICDVMHLFFRKPFWFSLSVFSILGFMRLRSRGLYILAAMDVRVIPR